MTTALAFQIVAFILERGIPAFISLATAWQKVSPSMTDFETLKSMMRRPEDF